MAYSSDKTPGGLTELTTLATDDVLVVGDTSDASEVAKKITVSNFLNNVDLTGQLTVGPDTLFAGSNNAAAQVSGTLNDYLMIYLQNKSTGDSASTDLVLAANNDDSSIAGRNVDLGYTGSGFVGTTAALGIVKTVSVTAGGTGYTVGNIITLSTGDGNCQVQVLTAPAGVVATVAIFDNGTNYTTGTKATTGGSGTGCTINVLTLIDFSLFGANEGYLYGTGGSLNIGTDDTVAGRVIKFFTGGTATTNERARIADTGLELGLTGTLTGALRLKGATSGTAILTVPTAAGTPTITLPTTTGKLALGAASSTDNAIVRFDGTTGDLIQNYTANAPTINDSGEMSAGYAAATNPILTITGGASGTDLVRLVRTSGSAATFGWGLTAGGLSFNDVTNGFTTTNIFGDSSINQLYIGQRGKGTADSARQSVLSSTTYATGTDISAGTFFIRGGQGTGAGTPGNLEFQTATALVSGATTQTPTTRLTISPTLITAALPVSARIRPRTGTATSSATPTINTDNVDFYSLTAQAVDITSFTTNLTGTPTDGQKLWIAITGTAARAITWGSSFEASTVALPTTTVTTARLDVGFVWNAVTSKWRCIAAA